MAPAINNDWKPGEKPWEDGEWVREAAVAYAKKRKAPQTPKGGIMEAA